MPRKQRFFIADVPNHIVQRGRNKDPIFFEAADYDFYLTTLATALEKYGAKLHAYVLMTNHVHLLMTGDTREAVSRVMQHVGRHYVPYMNCKYNFSGSLWEGGFKSNLIDSSLYLFSCMRYIELNPVRAGMVESPGKYSYSSYHKNALGEENPLITAQNEYLKLSDALVIRCQLYKSLFVEAPEKETVTQFRKSNQTGTPMGSTAFVEKIETTLKRKIGQTARGRPKM